jgi:hypothetical protein
MRNEKQLHATVLTVAALGHAQRSYSTVQNWCRGDEDDQRGIYDSVGAHYWVTVTRGTR